MKALWNIGGQGVEEDGVPGGEGGVRDWLGNSYGRGDQSAKEGK